MVHFTKDGYVITVSELEPFTGYKLLQKSLADVLCLVFANKDSIPCNDAIFYVSQFMGSLAEVEKNQSYELDNFVQKL